MFSFFRRFMYGRYGGDKFTYFLLIIAFIWVFISSVFDFGFISLLYLVPVIYALYRMFSKNVRKRYAENQRFIKISSAIPKKIKLYFRIFKERKTHSYLKCPKCKQIMRVPKGKGTMIVKCKNCSEQFKTKT